MPPWATTRLPAATTQTQFCFWLITMRRPEPDRAGTGRTSHRWAVVANSRVRVAAPYDPVCTIPCRDWNRRIAERVQVPLLPSTGPALQCSALSRRCHLATSSAGGTGRRTDRRDQRDQREDDDDHLRTIELPPVVRRMTVVRTADR